MQSRLVEGWKCVRLKVYVIFMLFPINICQRVCPTYDVKRSDFECKLHDNNNHLRIFCTGEVPPERLNRYEVTTYVYVFMISIDLPIENGHISLETLLKDPQTFHDDSNFYSCDRNFRNVLSWDLLSTELQCPIPAFDCLSIAHNVLLDKTITELIIVNREHLDVSNDLSSNLIGLLDLTVQNITKLTIDRKIIQDGTILHSLFLTNNNIRDEDLEQDVFSNMNSLQNLDLSHNNITKIGKRIFYNLQALSNLLLNHNSINFIDQHAFLSISNVKKLDLSHNNLNNISETIFDDITKLSTLDLSQNEIKELPQRLFWKLQGLKNVNLSKCELTDIPRDVFKNCHNLIHLDLSNNSIITLSNETFKTLVQLKYLDLSYNMIFWLSDDVLSTNVELETLLLSNNRIVTFSETFFSNAKSLRMLDVSGNELETIDDSYFQNVKDLYYLNATMNNITYVELGLYGKANVRKLDFSRNQISNFKIRWTNAVFLDSINFDFNNITEFKLPPCIPNMKNEAVFTLRHNKITTIYLNEDDNKDDTHCYFNGLPKSKVYLSENPFNCNCNFYDFYKYAIDTGMHVRHVFPDKDKMVCKKPSSVQGVKVINLPEDFMCPIHYNCPTNCTCGIRKRDDKIVVNCTSSGLNSFPDTAPRNTTILYAQHNEIQTLDGLGAPIWDYLQELHLDYNLIQSFERHQLPKYLVNFSISHNKLANLSISFRNFVSERNSFILTLGSNNWQCNCSSKTLKNWFIKEKSKITDLDDATCDVKESGSIRVVPLYRMPDAYLCPTRVSSIGTPTTYILTFGLFAVLLFFVVLLYFANRDTLKAYLYTHYNWLHECCFKSDDQEDSKLFDAFIAYSSHDKDMVMDIITELEGRKPSFKLCIHERDWMPGNFVSENIAISVQNSRRTILILSENFMASVWFGIEVRAALFQTLQDGGRNHRLVIVLAGDFAIMDQLDDDLKQTLLRKTYLEWGERWFWEKLRYAMPHEERRKRPAGDKDGDTKCNIVSIIEKDMFLTLNHVK